MAQLRHVENLRLRGLLATAEAELGRVREELVDADREIRALRDELDYCRQECDDLERQRDG